MGGKLNCNILIGQILAFIFLAASVSGVEYTYDANWKLTPPQLDPAWGGTYTSATAEIVNDGTENVLRLDNTSSSDLYYSYGASPGGGTIKDIVTINLRFRLIDVSQNDDTAQFVILADRPRADLQTGRQTCILRFARNGIKYLSSAGVYTSIPGTSLGTDWHEVRYVIDVANDQAEVYLDGSETPMVIHASYKDSSVHNRFVFGGTSGTFGKVDISSLYLESYSTDVKIVYNADSNSYPESINTAWYSSYSSANRTIITDGDEGLVLALDHTSSSPYYLYSSSPGSGTIDDIVTVNFRFRMPITQTESQFQVIVDRPRTDLQAGGQRYSLRFHNDNIEYYTSSGYIPVYINLGTDWHDARYVINVPRDEATLYIDGAAIPVITHCSRVYSTFGNSFFFGDNSSAVSGKVYLKSLSVESRSVEDATIELRKKRLMLAKKPRRIIFNNDGCDAAVSSNDPSVWTREVLVSRFLNTRTSGLANSLVDTIAYCTFSTSFCSFTYPTKASIVDNGNTYHGSFVTVDPATAGYYNIADDLSDKDAADNYILGTGPLKIVADWCRENGKELFWSMRMNDSHDAVLGADYLYWSDLKNDYPELLMASYNGSYYWSEVEYSEQIIRDITVAFITEVCDNYDIDGIELDFFRHLFLFRSVAAAGGTASETELDQLTSMMAEIRAMTEAIGLRRGKPLLVSIRVPDSIDYCRDIGIDLNQWLDDGLIDMIIGSGYFRLNKWSYLAALKNSYDIMVYAGLSEPRVYLEGSYKRKNDAVYRARALEALNTEVDGVYIFNEYNANATYLDQIGDGNIMNSMDQLYFLTYLDYNPELYLKNGNQHSTFNPEFRLPKEMDNTWYDSYGANESIIRDDDEGFVLALDHTLSSPYYRYSSSPGSGTIDDIVTVNFRFRMPITQTEGQFQVIVDRPRSDLQEGGQRYALRFHNDNIEYYTSSGFVPVNIDLGTDWHDARYVINVPGNEANLYIDGVATPVITHCSRVYSTFGNSFFFGDSSSAVSGKVYLKSLSLESSSASQKISYNVDLARTYIRFLTPEYPAYLFHGNPIYFYPELAEISGSPTKKVALYIPNYDSTQHNNLSVKFNGSPVTYQYDAANKNLEFTVTSTLYGENEIKLELPAISNFNPDNGLWVHNKIFDSPTSITYPTNIPLRVVYGDGMSVDDTVSELTINDDDSNYHFISLPVVFDPTKTTVIETSAKVITGSSVPDTSIVIRVANDKNVEYVSLCNGKIALLHGGDYYLMNTTDSFHEYKVIQNNNNILVYVDGILRLDGTGKFTTPVATDSAFTSWIHDTYKPLLKNSASIGSFSSAAQSESKWKYIRYNNEALIINDVVVDVKY